MSKFRQAIALALMVVMATVALYGCGGDNATPTPLASPTTALAEPSATTAMAEPTATTAMAESTATTSSLAGPTNTAGTSSGTGNDAAATDLMTKSATAMKDVKSYHIVMKTEAAGTVINAEGDVQVPDKTRLTMDMGAAGTTDVIVIGETAYVKVAGTDSWIETPSGSTPVGGMGSPEAFAQSAEGATIVGDETIDGVDTTHVQFMFDPNKIVSDAATAAGQAAPTPSDMGKANADMWVAKDTSYVQQLKYVVTTQGQEATVTIMLSKFNEDISPSIEKPDNVTTMPSIPGMETPTP